MTKRKGLLDVKVDVRGLLEEIPVSSSIASKPRAFQYIFFHILAPKKV
ncbi:hypothetical protein [Peribacillus butanolivorans]|nr:hypothetical protein [Peribacillus butanolivorans]